MPGPTAHRLLRCSALLVLLNCRVAEAGPLVWEHRLDAPSRERLDIHYAEPLADGGYRLVGGVIDVEWDGLGNGYYGVFQDFDAGDRPLGPPRLGPPPRLRTPGASSRNVALPLEPRAFDLALRRLPPSPCVRRALDGGRELRQVDRQEHLLGYYFGGLDGEGGSFAAAFGPAWPEVRSQRLFRQQIDCALEPLGEFPFDFDSLHNSSVEPAAFAVTSAPGEPGRLRYFDRSGQRWQLEPRLDDGQPGGFQSLLEIDGDLLIGVIAQHGTSLRRIRPDGTARWSTSLPRPFVVGSAELTPRGVLLAGRTRQAHPVEPYDAILIDAGSGALRWTHAGSQLGRERWVPAAKPEAGGALLAFPRTLQAQALVEFDAKGEAHSRGQLPWDAEPLLRLADGRVLAARGDPFGFGSTLEAPGRRLIRVQPQAASIEATGEAVEVDWVPRAVAALPDGEGSLLLSVEAGRHALQAIDGSGRTRWRRLLPAHDLGGTARLGVSATLRADGALVCLILRRESWEPEVRAERSLSCLDRSDGSPRLLRADFFRAQDADAFPSLLRDAGDGRVQLFVHVRRRCPSGGTWCYHLERVDFDSEGGTQWQLLMEATANRRPVAQLLLGGGELLASDEASDGRDLRLLAINPSGHVRVLEALTLPTGPPRLASRRTDDGGAVLLIGSSAGDRSVVRRLAGDGRTLQAFEVEGSPVAPVPALGLDAKASGFAFTLFTEGGGLQVSRHDASGKRLWQREVGAAALERVVGLLLESDGAVRLVTQRDQRLLLQRLAAADGQLQASDLLGSARRLHGGVAWKANGDAVLLTEGERVYDQPPRPAALQRFRLRESAGCTEPLPSGFWFDPGSAGQGLFFHPAAEGSVLTATWLTFTADGDTDRADLRWFSLFGETDGSGPTRLEVQSSRGGRFVSAAASDSETVGEVRIERLRCDLLAVDYGFDAGELSDREGRLHLVPAAPPGTGNEGGGIWFDPQTAGQGLLLQSLDLGHGGQRLVGAWATFDPEGAADDPSAQHWLTLDGPRAADGSYRVDILRTIGGSFDGRATANHIKAGEAILRFEACDRLQLDYRFEGNGAAEFAGRQGSLVLQRLDGCSVY